MKKSFYFASLLLAMALTAFTACGGSDDDDDKGSTDKDTRISQVIPQKYRAMLEKYIPIYDGVNPPDIEGIYLVSPTNLVYDSTDKYEVGYKFTDMFYDFYNQTTSNTISYRERSNSGNSQASGNGAFISGEGSNFTVYITATGSTYGIPWKRVNIFSGTVTSSGIKNFRTGWIYLEKGDDPEHKIVNVGDYRVFRDGDGSSEFTSWPTDAPEFDFTRATVEELPGESAK